MGAVTGKEPRSGEPESPPPVGRGLGGGQMKIGVDLGGSKIEAAILADDGRIAWRARVPTPRGDYAATVGAVAALVNEGIANYSGGGTAVDARTPVGVGIPGAESLDSGLVKNANSTWLIDRPLRTDLAAALGRPVRLANDANCFALSEAVDGAAAGADVVFGVILGTGVGGGIVIRRQVLAGANAIAGEWGHNPLPGASEDRACYCGRTDCIETYLSGPALEAEVARAGGAAVPADEIARRAALGDALCAAALDRHTMRLARALAGVINLLDPDVIVLGGGLSNIDRLVADVARRWRAWVFSDSMHTQLVRAHHGDSSGVRGAAWLWP